MMMICRLVCMLMLHVGWSGVAILVLKVNVDSGIYFTCFSQDLSSLLSMMNCNALCCVY